MCAPGFTRSNVCEVSCKAFYTLIAGVQRWHLGSMCEQKLSAEIIQEEPNKLQTVYHMLARNSAWRLIE